MYSRTVVLKSNIRGLVDPAGWTPWNGKFADNTLYYGEYITLVLGQILVGGSTGLVENFVGGDKWIPSTGVLFKSGLTLFLKL
ncbi:putative pectinesterase/pectinesterase inhibitor 36 [Bienertia sinuspersici]